MNTTTHAAFDANDLEILRRVVDAAHTLFFFSESADIKLVDTPDNRAFVQETVGPRVGLAIANGQIEAHAGDMAQFLNEKIKSDGLQALASKGRLCGLAALLDWVRANLKDSKVFVKGIDSLRQAIDTYRDRLSVMIG